MKATDKPSFTAGPWNVLESAFSHGPHGELHVLTPNRTCAVLYFDRSNPADARQCQANAALIASAPELYEALAALVKWMEDSKLTHTKSVGVHPFVTEPVEYSVITQARAALSAIL